MKKPTIYCLTAEDMTDIGSMHSQTTSTIFQKYYTTIEFAKAAAQRHYKAQTKSKEQLRWRANSTGDLGWVMYDITKVKIEK